MATQINQTMEEEFTIVRNTKKKKLANTAKSKVTPFLTAGR